MNDNLKTVISSVAPWLTAALPGPLGAMANGVIQTALGKTPDELEKLSASDIVTLKSAESDFKLKAMEMGYKSLESLGAQEVEVIKEVNSTMRIESTSDHWPSYTWRPFIGLSFGMYVNSLWLLPLFKITPVVMNPDLVLAVGGILGVASWFRGKAQVDNNNPITKG